LPVPGAQAVHERGDVRRLDALDDDGDVEAVREVDDRGRDGPGLRFVDERGGERAVDLQHVGGQAPQVAEGGVPGAEVVDGDGDAGLREAAQAADGGAVLVDQDRLGDLD